METAYGLWPLVIFNSLIFIIFAFSFTKPKTSRDWRSFGAFSAFIVALFTEMYGFPLTIYLLSGWLSAKFPGVDFLTHNSGHLLEDMFGWGGDPHFGPFHIISYVLIGYGFILLANSWQVLYKAQRDHSLATTGPYARIRHPQYPHHARLSVPMAYDPDDPHVPGIGMDVYPTGKIGRSRFKKRIRRNVECLCKSYTSVHSASQIKNR
jgi:protein-S-isoprenylcysteine O-methyltransferase Ste14